MARPKKTNADYFPHDADMRNDPKIKALRRKFEFVGFSIWVMLLEILTDAEYFEYEWSELNIELLAGDFDVEPETLKEVIEYCITINLLKKENNIIYSQKLKDRFENLLQRRSDDRKRKNNEFSTRKTPQGKPDKEKPQSKVKESKVKESKEEKEREFRAFDFLKSEYPSRFETDFQMKYGNKIKNKSKFVEDFNDTVESEKRELDSALFGRLGKYARNWIDNQDKYNAKKVSSNPTQNIAF